MSRSPLQECLLRWFLPSYDFAIRHTRERREFGRRALVGGLALVMGRTARSEAEKEPPAVVPKRPAPADLVREMESSTERVMSVASSPDGRFVLSASQDRTIRLCRVATGEQLLCLRKHTGPVRRVLFSDDRVLRLWRLPK